MRRAGIAHARWQMAAHLEHGFDREDGDEHGLSVPEDAVAQVALHVEVEGVWSQVLVVRDAEQHAVDQNAQDDDVLEGLAGHQCRDRSPRRVPQRQAATRLGREPIRPPAAGKVVGRPLRARRGVARGGIEGKRGGNLRTRARGRRRTASTAACDGSSTSATGCRLARPTWMRGAATRMGEVPLVKAAAGLGSRSASSCSDSSDPGRTRACRIVAAQRAPAAKVSAGDPRGAASRRV